MLKIRIILHGLIFIFMRKFIDYNIRTFYPAVRLIAFIRFLVHFLFIKFLEKVA